MAIWIELHCDALLDGVDACGRCSCYSQGGIQMGVMASIASRVPALLRDLERVSIKDGWRKRKGKWTCPDCVKRLTPAPE